MIKKTLQLGLFWSGTNALLTYTIYRYHLNLLKNEHSKNS